MDETRLRKKEMTYPSLCGAGYLWKKAPVQKKPVWTMEKKDVRSGIRTHAHKSGLRPERSALDHSAILTWL